MADSARSVQTTKLRLRRIQVSNLFGYLKHEIRLNEDDRVTIVLGANGVGKTQLFECVAALFGGRLSRLTTVPFDRIDIDLDNGNTLRIVQLTSQLPAPPPEIRLQRERVAVARTAARAVKRAKANPRIRRSLTVQLFDENGSALTEPWEPDFPTKTELPNWIDQIEPGLWYDSRLGRTYPIEDLRQIYGLSDVEDVDIEARPSWFKEITERTSVRLVETQRLIRTQPRATRAQQPNQRDTIVELAVYDLVEDLAERKRLVIQGYTRQQSLFDQSYVNRFLSYAAPQEYLGELDSTLALIAKRRVRLEQLGLIDVDESYDTAARTHGVSDEKRSALSLYASDMDKKLRILEPLADRLEYLITAVNRKLQSSGKRLTTDAQFGLSIETSSEGQYRLPLEMLSSGEQHQLVLLYELLFRVPPDSLVLIDEPELSLHPTWQEEFVQDLLEIAESRRFDVVLATHSPYIVGERGALCVVLRNPLSDQGVL